MKYLCCLVFYYFVTSALAMAFSTHLIITGNSLLSVDYRQSVELPPIASPSPEADCLVFSYRLFGEVGETILPDWPLLLLLSGEEVIFYATSSTFDGEWHQVMVDKKYLEHDLRLWQNDLALGLLVETTPLTASMECDVEWTMGMSDLLLVRENDDSLTVLFKQSDDQGGQARYELSCLDADAESEPHILAKQHFSWPAWRFNFDLSMQGEFIFQVNDSVCQNQAVVRDLFTNQTVSNTIVRVGDLQ